MPSESRRVSIQEVEVLHLMLLEPARDCYGLELALHAAVPNGTIYALLRRLEQDGWVSALWEASNDARPDKPARKLYRLTGQGMEKGGHLVQQVRDFFADRTPLSQRHFAEPRRTWSTTSAREA